MHSGLPRQETSLAVSGAAGTVRLLSQLPFPWLITPCEPPGAMGALCKPSADQLLPGAEKLGALVITFCLSAGNASSFLKLHRSDPCFLLHPKAKNVMLPLEVSQDFLAVESGSWLRS